MLRGEARNLAAQLGADGTAGAGDQHDLAGQLLMQARIVQLYRVATQQIVQFHRAQLRDGDATAQQIVESGHGKCLDAVAVRQIDGLFALLVRGRRHGNDDLRDAQSFRPVRQAIQLAQHLDAVEHASLLIRIVVEKSDLMPVAATCQILGQADTRFSRPQHQHRLALQLDVSEQPLFFPQAIDQTVSAHCQQQQDRVDDQNRTRDDRIDAEHPQHQRNKRGCQQHRHEDTAQVRHTGEAPDAAIQAHVPEDNAIAAVQPTAACATSRFESCAADRN